MSHGPPPSLFTIIRLTSRDLGRRAEQYHPGPTAAWSTDDLSKHASTGLPPIDPAAYPEASPVDQDQRAPRPVEHIDRPLGHAHAGQCRRARKGHPVGGRLGRDETARRSGRGRGEDVEGAEGWDRCARREREHERECRIRIGPHRCRDEWRRRCRRYGRTDAQIGRRLRGAQEREYSGVHFMATKLIRLDSTGTQRAAICLGRFIDDVRNEKEEIDDNDVSRERGLYFR